MSDLPYEKLPQHLRDGIQLWIERGIRPGSFLTAVLENDLMEAINRADNHSLANLKLVCQWIYWEAPGACHGNPDRVATWRGTRP